MEKLNIIVKLCVTAIFTGIFFSGNAFADYHQINAQKTKAPSFEMVGTVPLTQVGYGIPKIVTFTNQYTTVGNVLEDVIPREWNYYVSETVNLEYRVNIAADTASWVGFVEKLAKKLNLRTLVDWNAKAILIVSASGETSKSYFVTPRSEHNSLIKITVPKDLAPAQEVVTGDPMRKLNLVK